MHTPFMDKSPHGHSHGRGSAGGRLKQRLAHILTRSSCTTNTTSASSGPATAFVSLAKAGAADSSHHQEAPPSPYFCTPCTYERPKVDGAGRPRRRRSASLVHISVDCTGGASGRRSVYSDAPLMKHRQSSAPARDVTRRQSKGRSRSKPAAARSPSASRRHCSSSSSSWGRARRPRPSSTPAPYSWSSTTSSSNATDDELAPSSGSDDEEAETRTLFSSLSLSSDSTASDFYHANGRVGTGNTRRSHRSTGARRHHAPRRALPRTSDPVPAPPDAFRPLVSVETTKTQRECNERSREEKGLNATKPMRAAAEEKEKETKPETGAGMAVVKRSSNPYLDFRSSMVEMVVERRIGSVGQMEELLGSYLSLNSPRHHPAILAAFEDVWEAVFGDE